MTPTFMESNEVTAWIGQFMSGDQADAISLLRALMLVSRDEFAEQLRTLVRQCGRTWAGPLALYAERELVRRDGKPDRLFQESDTEVRRAVGAGPFPVFPTRIDDPQVGSEGIVAQLITELCREPNAPFLDHPGPDRIRREKVRHLVVVTDLIASGRRARDYVDAAWQSRSVRSWHSWHLLKLAVIAYSGTDSGRQFVQKHPSHPLVEIVTPCPTVDSLGSREIKNRLRDLCRRYDPVDHDPERCLGVGGRGTLIAFAHGVPNNAPRILHKSSPRWTPLFPARVTAAARVHFRRLSTPEATATRLLEMRQPRLASGPWLNQASEESRGMILMLAAMARGPRHDDVLARRTGLTILDVRHSVSEATRLGWIDATRRLTDRGHTELDHARRWVHSGP